MKKLLGPIGGFLAIIGVIFGAYLHLVSTFATCGEVQQLRQENQQIRQDMNYVRMTIQQEAIDRRIWIIKERHGENPKDKTINEELQKLKDEYKQIKEQKKSIEEKK